MFWIVGTLQTFTLNIPSGSYFNIRTEFSNTNWFYKLFKYSYPFHVFILKHYLIISIFGKQICRPYTFSQKSAKIHVCLLFVNELPPYIWVKLGNKCLEMYHTAFKTISKSRIIGNAMFVQGIYLEQNDFIVKSQGGVRGQQIIDEKASLQPYQFYLEMFVVR